MKILFVLGAGASKEVGYPLGSELKARLLTSLVPSNTMPERLLKANNTKEDLKDFEHKLRHADFDTIDQFLEARCGTEHLRKIGREVLVGTIAYAEAESQPTLFNGGAHWYRALLDYLWRNQGAIKSRDVGFVTFNYDRSLTHYLHETISSRTDELTAGMRKDFLGDKNLIHVHGHIGYLPWQPVPTSRPFRAREYGEVMEAEDLLNTGRNVLLPHESFETAAGIRELVRGAEVIAFLGFGFHAQNLARIHFNEMVTSKAAIYATAFNLNQAARERIANPRITLVDAETKTFVPEFLRRVETNSLNGWDAASHFKPSLLKRTARPKKADAGKTPGKAGATARARLPAPGEL